MFDDALLESGKTHALGAKRLSLPLAIGLHAAVIGALVGASAWLTGEAPELAIPILFPVVSTGAPPPQGGTETPRTPRGARPHAAVALVQPNPSPVDPITPLRDVDEASQADDSDSESAGPGRPDGVPGSLGPSDGQPGGGELSKDGQIFPVGGDVRAPVLLARIEPDFPEAARRARLQGTVILEAVITISGDVQEIRVLKALNPLLDEAAERAVRQWRYRPATLNGRAVPVYLTVTVRFGIAN